LSLLAHDILERELPRLALARALDDRVDLLVDNPLVRDVIIDPLADGLPGELMEIISGSQANVNNFSLC
jgi:hypothetical protein